MSSDRRKRDISIAELELLLLPDGKRPSEMTPADWRGTQAALDALTERYGEERIAAMLRELVAMTGTEIRALLRGGR